MNNLLVELAEKLSVLSRLEYDFIITFSAGQAIRKAEQKTFRFATLYDKIRSQLQESLEK